MNYYELLKDAPDFVKDNLIYLTYHGSRVYKINDKDSDVDLVGVCIPDEKYIYPGKYGYIQSFEESPKFDQFKKHGIVIDGVEHDITIYGLPRYFKLCMDGNPNMIETMFTENSDVVVETRKSDKIRENSNLFISKACFYKFMGFAKSHLNRVEKCSGRQYLVEEYGYDCYLEENTEFLTDRGWLKFDKILDSDKLGTVNPISGNFKLQKFQSKIDKKYTGNLYTIEPFGTKCQITENHNLLISDTHRSKKNNWSIQYIDKDSNWRLQSLKSILDDKKSVFHYRKSPSVNKRKEIDIDDDLLIITGLYLSEGTSPLRNNKTKCVKITQTENGKQSVFDFMDSVYKKYNFKKYDYGKETIWTSYHKDIKRIPELFGRKKEKKVPEILGQKLSTRQVELLWRGLMMGDGTYYDDSFVYYSCSKKLIDSIQYLMTCAGINTSLNGPFENISNFTNLPVISYQLYRPLIDKEIGVLYTSRKVDKKNIPISNKLGFPIKYEKVNNKRVVCFQVKNGTLITRNNGKISIQGNCKDAGHLIRAYYECINLLKEKRIILDYQRDLIYSIKKGKYSREYIISLAKNLEEICKKEIEKSTLQETVDIKKIKNLLEDLIYE